MTPSESNERLKSKSGCVSSTSSIVVLSLFMIYASALFILATLCTAGKCFVATILKYLTFMNNTFTINKFSDNLFHLINLTHQVSEFIMAYFTTRVDILNDLVDVTTNRIHFFSKTN